LKEGVLAECLRRGAFSINFERVYPLKYKIMRKELLLVLSVFIIALSFLIGSLGYTQDSPPVPQFSADVLTGPAPLTVQFSDQSSGNRTGWTWYFGDEDYTGTWELVNENAAWPARYSFSSVVLPEGSIVLTGGFDTDNEPRGDVWRSTDGGETWTRLLLAAPWSRRADHSSVTLPDGSIVLMGGRDAALGAGNGKNDVWLSTDGGATWTEQTGSAPWEARFAHKSVVLPDGSIILTGGVDSSLTEKNDVWRSTDKGETWERLTANAAWSARSYHSGVVLPDSSIILMGGGLWPGARINDVWRSTDGGATWTEQTASAPWTARDAHSSVALPDGSIILMGGRQVDQDRVNDTWRSTDQGATWKLLDAENGWPERAAHTSMVLPDGSVILIGGIDPPVYYNDVWRLETASSYAQNPEHTYETPGKYRVTLQAYNTGGSGIISKRNYIYATPEFSGEPLAGSAPLEVQFTDQTGGEAGGWTWYFGDEAMAEPWEQISANAAWAGRSGHSSVALPDGSIILTGGYDGTSRKNDVWRSTDGGANWSQLTDSAQWTARSDHTTVALHDGSIVLMGGFSPGIEPYRNDVWRSTDRGENWVCLTDAAQWSRRDGLSSVVLTDGSIILTGGFSEGDFISDVWRSTDGGENWEQLAASVWPGRPRQSSVALPDDSIVVTAENFVWRSPDGGTTWFEINDQVEWGMCYYQSAAALPDGSIIVSGGSTIEGTVKNDVWRSVDGGATWSLLTEEAPWPARFHHRSVVLPDGSIVLMGGNDAQNPRFNDVWRLETAGSNEKNPVHIYKAPGTYQVTLQTYNAGSLNSSSKPGYIEVLNLSGLAVDPGSLQPAFDSTETEYSVEVAHDVNTIAVTATLHDPGATVIINGDAATSGEAKSIALGDPATVTVIEVVVSDADGVIENTYTITVNRAPEPGSDATLSGLTVSVGSLVPDFNWAITEYTVDVAYDVDLLAVTATLSDPGATVIINGDAATSGEAKSIALGNPGTATVIAIVVTSADGVTENNYTITVNRADTTSFSDVPPDHPFYDEIEALVAAGITGGFPDGTFRPSASVTRMAMAAFLVRALDLEDQYDVPTTPTFSDVPLDHQFYDEIELLAASGITGGFTDGTFRPSNSVTRMAMAAFLVRALDLEDQYDVPTTPTFSDVPLDHQFYDEIELLAASGITGGFTDGTFRPSASVTRMAMAAFLARALDL